MVRSIGSARAVRCAGGHKKAPLWPDGLIDRSPGGAEGWGLRLSPDPDAECTSQQARKLPGARSNPHGPNLYEVCRMPPERLVWKSIGEVCAPAKCHSPFAFIAQYRAPTPTLQRCVTR
jgi:hypothetical protein